MRERFDQELNHLNSDVVRMGAFVESAIEHATSTLCSAQLREAEEALRFETEVERLEQSIEARCLRLILQEQPVASDLRLVSAALKMITDMKRIGDQAVNIAYMVLRHPEITSMEGLAHLRSMGKATTKMIAQAVDAFVARDLELANVVINGDDYVDKLFDDVRRDLIDLIRSDVGDVEAALNLFLIAKYFERIGDHTVNVAYWVRYAITGAHRGHESR